MKKSILVSAVLLLLFVLWTAAVCTWDVRAIGPEGTSVGFAGLNGYVHRLTGVHMKLYVLTDWLGLVPVATVMGFGILGLCQWIRRRKIWKVDRSILVLGGFYAMVLGVFLFFESWVVNYRPILIEGILEASYPSSTTMLSMCMMPAALLQLRSRMKNIVTKHIVTVVIVLFTAFMVTGRILSGVHWFTDIIGGMLISAGLVTLYHALAHMKS